MTSPISILTSHLHQFGDLNEVLSKDRTLLGSDISRQLPIANLDFSLIVSHVVSYSFFILLLFYQKLKNKEKLQSFSF